MLCVLRLYRARLESESVGLLIENGGVFDLFRIVRLLGIAMSGHDGWFDLGGRGWIQEVGKVEFEVGMFV